MTARTIALALALPFATTLGCAPPCTDDGLQQDCNDEPALVTVAVDESDDDDDDDDDGSTSSGDEGDDDDDDDDTSPADDEGTETAPAEESSSSDEAPLDDDAGTGTEEGPLDEGPMEESSSEDDGTEPLADEYESCATNECVAGSQCIDITDLEEYDPFCSPDCESDADCPSVGGGVESWCALVPDGELDPASCVLVCSYDDDVLGDCPGAMDCIEVPGQDPPISVCMWS